MATLPPNMSSCLPMPTQINTRTTSTTSSAASTKSGTSRRSSKASIKAAGGRVKDAGRWVKKLFIGDYGANDDGEDARAWEEASMWRVLSMGYENPADYAHCVDVGEFVGR